MANGSKVVSGSKILSMDGLEAVMFGDSEMKDTQKKILGFVDNRQDAAMQSGHFNDFVSRTIMRAAMLATLRKQPDKAWKIDELTKCIFDILGFSDYDDEEAQSDLYQDPDLAIPTKRKMEADVLEILQYRLLRDLNRSWVYTNPTLQHLGLMDIGFELFDEMMSDEKRIAACEVLPEFSDKDRRHLMDALLREMAGSYCVYSSILDYQHLSTLKGRNENRLNKRWQIGELRDLRIGARLSTTGTKKLIPESGAGVSYLSSSNVSRVGRRIKKDPAWRNTRFSSETQKKQGEACQKLISELLDLARAYGILIKGKIPRNDAYYYQIDSNSITWHLGKGKPEKEKWRNAYYSALYDAIADQFDHNNRSLFRYESREHTAQVPADERMKLEKQFRGEDGKRLPVLYCSPTMELGIDIGKLERVIQIEAPNTVSNFLQRLGRSGRRSNTPEMIMVFREEEALPNTPLPQLIPWELLRGIAIIQLYIEERFIEPPSRKKLPFSLLFHQTLSVLASSGELSSINLAFRVLSLPPFECVSREDYKELLISMLNNDFLEMTEEKNSSRKKQKLL